MAAGAVRQAKCFAPAVLRLGGVRDAGHDLGGTTGGLGALSAGTCPGEGASLSGCVQRPTLYAVLPDGREWTPPAMHACPRWIDGRDRWARLLLLSSLRTMRADLRRGGRHASDTVTDRPWRAPRNSSVENADVGGMPFYVYPVRRDRDGLADRSFLCTQPRHAVDRIVFTFNSWRIPCPNLKETKGLSLPWLFLSSWRCLSFTK